MSFTDIQKKQLSAPLDKANVKSREQSGRSLSYVEGWHVIAEANRIFGFDAWTRELVSLVENTAPTTNSRGNHVVSFRATARITANGIVREGTGFGSGVSKDIHDAYESAVKEAETDAMKRAFMTFGNPFGLALYDKAQTNVVEGPSPRLEALLTHMPTGDLDAARTWKEREKPEIDSLSNDEFATFKEAWQRNLRNLSSQKEAA